MKKLNYLLLGLAGLALASCANEDLQGPAEGTYQLTVNLPKDMSTRAIGDEITAPQTLSYTVFTYDGVYVTEGTQAFGTGQTSTTLNLPLVKGNGYKIAFFSQSTSSADVYSYNEKTAEVTVTYDNMTYGDNVNADAYDCFSGKYEIEKVEGALAETVTLTRPVAQINWGTNDLTSAAVQQAFGAGTPDLKTTLTATVPSSLNILSGEYGAADEVTFPVTALPSTEEAFPVSGYDYLAMQYVLADGTMTSNLTLTVTGQNNAAAEPIEIEVASAPIQTNYRTNIYGGLLTDQANFNVTLSSTWGAPSNNIGDGAMVELQENGTFYCTTPVLPVGVTEADMAKEDVGAVALSADGTPVYFPPTSEGIKNAMASYSEIYLAPNTEITTQSHQMVVPQSGVTIHGNGATFKGGEQDFSIQTTYDEDSTIDLTISNLNGMKIWGGPNGAFTLNINLTNCTLTGGGRAANSLSLAMIRGGDDKATINFNVNSCYVQNAQVGIYSSHPGTMEFNNCVFTDVGIPLNIAKKLAETADITVNNCIFNECGITPNDPTNSAWDYSAPVRVVDNAGPTNSITLLVENCTFNNTLSEYDILLWDYRTNEERTSYPVNLTVKNCTPADPVVYTIDKVTTMGPNTQN